MTPAKFICLREHPDRRSLAAVQRLVDKRATDEGLWFIAQTAPEAYLQQELRKLHGAVEIMAMDDRT
jgi:hypothetical protein